MHRWVSTGDGTGDTCLECALVVEAPDTTVATRDIPVGTAVVPTDFTAAQLAPQCTGVRRHGEAHHFAPTVDGIACQWCAVEVTPDTDWAHVPVHCDRPV